MALKALPERPLSVGGKAPAEPSPGPAASSSTSDLRIVSAALLCCVAILVALLVRLATSATSVGGLVALVVLITVAVLGLRCARVLSGKGHR